MIESADGPTGTNSIGHKTREAARNLANDLGMGRTRPTAAEDRRHHGDATTAIRADHRMVGEL